MTHVRTRTRIGTIAAGALALILATAGVVSADTHVSSSGLTGTHALRDTSSSNRGATCRYSNGSNLDQVTVRTPIVYARNRTAAVDAQWVGWRARLQQFHPSDGHWYTVQTGSVRKAVAHDNAAAGWTTATVFTVVQNSIGGAYRVRVSMYWYAPGSSTTLQGSQLHEVDYYRSLFGPVVTTQNQECVSSAG